MFEQIESQMIEALAPLTDRFVGLTLRAGPHDPRGRGPTLTAWVRGLRHTPRDRAERPSPRLGARLALQRTNDARTWLLVGGEGAELTELLASDGRALIRGEDWSAEPGEGGTLLRLRTAAAAPPLAWLRGPLARGFQARGPCAIALVIVAVAPRIHDADAMTRAALERGIPALAALPPLEWTSFPARPPIGVGVRARIDGPQVTLRRQVRRWVADDPAHAVVTTKLRIDGELELEVAVAAPGPDGVIARVVGHVDGAAITLAGARAHS